MKVLIFSGLGNRLAVYEVEHLIGGRWRVDEVGRHFTVVNPETDKPFSRVPVATVSEIDDAVSAARAAACGWACRPAAERARLLRDAACALEDDASELAALTMGEMGRPFGQALEGVHAGVGTLRQYGELAAVHRGRSLAGDVAAVDAVGHMGLTPRRAGR